LVIILSGGGVMVWLVKTPPAPNRHASTIRLTTVAVQTVVPKTVAIPVVGYGTVRPKNQVQIIPQVSGELVFSHADLAEGKIIVKGALLFEMDPTVYLAHVQQTEAEVRALEAVLTRHDQEMANLDARIIMAEKMLAIDKRDYLNSKHLLEQEGVGTAQGLDVTHQKYLQRQDLVLQFKHRRATAPHLKRETLAKLDATQARLQQAQYNLKNTKIFCPFTARVESVKAHQTQMVTAHLSIATLTDMEAFEIPISVDPRELRWLDQRVQPQALEQESDNQRPVVNVAWSVLGQQVQWRGHVARFERMDEATRTARMIVEIPRANMAAERGAWWHDAPPSISIGMRCRAELPAEPLVDAILVPWHTIHEGRWVYVFEPAADETKQGLGRLGRREVSILRMMDDEVLVDFRGLSDRHTCQLKPGEQLVVSLLPNPVVGMKVVLPPSLESDPIEQDRLSSTASAGITAMGRQVTRLAMSNTAVQTGTGE